MSKIRVLLADDHPIVRTGIRAMLQSAVDIDVVAEAKSGAEALALVELLQPDVLLLDMEMPGMSGVDVAKRLKILDSAVRVLALSAYDDAQYVRNLLASGAAGYLTKEEAPEMIIDAVRGVARGEEGWLSRRAVAKVTAWARQEQDDSGKITEREQEVLGLVVAGKTNQEIALALKISEKTVEKHVGSILSKLGVASRVEAAVQAVQRGLV
ncbi:MAG: DNA-binding response regulator [Chloroflexi bacterium]|nr:MAG: DNA-binding response regulator [Chloroflexota bacterium]